MKQAERDHRDSEAVAHVLEASPSSLLAPFTAHILRFRAEVEEPVLLNEHKGSALRGAFFQALRGRFCFGKEYDSCHPCPLHAACPICTLVATVDDAALRGADPPRPFVVDPPLDAKTLYREGEELEFGLTLFGDGLKLFPYVVVAFQEAGQSGLGKRLPRDGSFQQGRFTIRSVEAVNPLSGEKQAVKSEGDDLIRVPNIPVTNAQVTERVNGEMGKWGSGEMEPQVPLDSRLSTLDSTLTLRFSTPVRLIDGGRLVHPIRFRPLIQRLFERLSGLASYYAAKKEEVHFVELLALAERVEVVEDKARWVELDSYSTRQRRSTPMGGQVGTITFAGDLAPFLPFLVWGQFTHVGKDATKGNGWYRVEGKGEMGKWGNGGKVKS